MITERCRMSVTDTVLVFLAAFVLVSTSMAPCTPLQTVIVSENHSESGAYAVPINHRELTSIRNRLESYGKATDHPLLGTNLWIAQASRFYANAAEPLWKSAPSPSTIQQVSHQTPTFESDGAHKPAERSWLRIAAEADARIDQIRHHQNQQLHNLRPAPVKLGSVVNVFWTRSSLITAMVVGLIVVMLVAVWKRVSPTRQFQPLSVSQKPSAGIDHQWIAIDVLPEWICLHQTNGAILRRGFVILLVACATFSMCFSFTSISS